MSDVFRSTVDVKPISSINPFDNYVSPPRQTMLGGNLTQSNVVDGATRMRIRSGVQREHAKGTYKHMFDDDVTIVAVIPRFPDYALKNKFARNPMDLVIYEVHETKQLGCLELHKFHCAHQHFGFNYNFNEELMDKLEEGQRIPKGTVLADSPNVTPDGDYMLGLETKVAFVTDPSVTEDGFALSESYANRIRTHGFETRTFTCGRSHYPVNVNGNQDEYKCIPDLGDTINKNGMIAAFRPFDEILNPIYTTRKKLMTASYGMDIPLYGIAGARVVDIKVLHNENVTDRGLPSEFTDQLRYYHELEKDFYMKVLKVCLAPNGKWLDENVQFEPDLWRVLYEAIAYCGDEIDKKGWWPKGKADLLRVNKSYRGQVLDEWRVEITFEYTTEVAEGPKLTNLQGGLLTKPTWLVIVKLESL